ncbi:Bacterial alpha-L-rhamnosidase [Spirosoma sp. HMF4905]|uniref:alpha-L-rhamnosidase n=1 Tax=Spirosoma arboris TaxID=2682092 RepID=A0A7K1S792_9BACT|nr:glycoside hydrolase family 78 protein [Spirosoma arboris]MVM29629.1 Bacterial alpha-L-rhamnosidase [Spirosoma arboris]
MKKCLSLFALLQLISTWSLAQSSVQQLLTENRVNPIGLDVTIPRLSWQLIATKQNVRQTAYEVRVNTDAASIAKGAVWQSGRVASDQSVHVLYAGTALKPGQRYFWQVRIWDNTATKPSAWSPVAYWQTGLLTAGNWKAKWIEPGYVEDTVNRPSPLMRKVFATPKKVRSATLSITAHGLYEAQINGKRVGDAYLTPGWTSYNNHLQYQTYDVTNLINQGQNAIGVSLASGWYRGRLVWENQRNMYGKNLALVGQLAITYTDGSSETVITDESWKSSTGPVRFAEIYDGEIYDSRLEKAGWTTAGYADSDWSGVMTKPFGYTNLVANYNELVGQHETRKPVKVITTPKGETVLDFGQNLVGWVKFKVTGKAGDKIVLSHVEMLDKFGNPYFENLRTAKALATYLLKGGTETLEPHFTFFGFRYVQINGLTGPINPADFTAITLYSDIPKTGEFTTSNALVNQLQSNIQWGQRGNFLDVPTDCPQRDERLGWTGDAEVFSRTAAFNFGVNNFFAKWLKDVTADQFSNGAVPFIIPDVLNKRPVKDEPAGAAGWSDASIIIPWNMYLAYGDRRIVEQQYATMKAYEGYMERVAKNDLWSEGFQFGDWLSYVTTEGSPAFEAKSAFTDNHLVAQCFYAYSTDLMRKAAMLLGKTEDVTHYAALLERIKKAFQNAYMTPSGRLISDTQTAYVLALQFDMIPENLRPQAVDRLVDNVKKYNNHLTTGFLGTPFLCHVLTRFGRTDVAYKLLLQETYPSWLYPVKMGATTIWERWDSMKPDSTFQSPSMTSFNHYAYGAVGDWMYRTITGIDTDETDPGYKHTIIKPQPGGGLTSASASLQTYYGTVRSSWKKEADKLSFTVEIPANTTATIYVPAKNAEAVLESGKSLSAAGLTAAGSGPGYVVLKIGSGVYNFTSSGL